MGRRSEWEPVVVKSLDRTIVGPVIKAYRHGRQADTFLFHLKFLSRNHPQFRRQGMWAVVAGTRVVRRRGYWLKGINKPPFRWANQVLRFDGDGTYARKSAAQASMSTENERPKRHRCAVDYHDRAHYDELPAMLFPFRNRTSDAWLKRACLRKPRGGR
jgi:hypothetical protein